MPLPTAAKRPDDHETHPRTELSNTPDHWGLIGESRPMHCLYELTEKAAHSVATVLLTGDTGTGKELVARAIHLASLRRAKMFVPIDCSALTPTLIESELFGHVKGAFTGADRSKAGLLQASNEGTLFLDEVGELPMLLQAKLLRTLQEHEIRPIGSTVGIPIDVRVIAATNRDLEEGVRLGTFRQDLYFRLNVVRIKLPTLRERKSDIPQLVAHFLEKFSNPQHPVLAISNDSLLRLMAYDWPGNVRELENAIECAVALCSDGVLALDELTSLPCSAGAPSVPDADELVPLAELERRAILRALRKTGGDKLGAARLLAIGKTTLYRKLKEYAGALKSADRGAS